MGAIWINRGDFIARTGDTVGFKSGLGLTREEFDELIPKEYHQYWFGKNEELIRIRSEEFEEIISECLYRVGNIESPSIAPISIRLFHKYRDNPHVLNIVEQLLIDYTDFITTNLNLVHVLKSRLMDPTPFIYMAKEKFGLTGNLIAIEMIEGQIIDSHRNPWNSIRRVEWKDVTELRGLFKDESLETFHGRFLDQRFIDYLDKNFSTISEIHWRKFEGLTCEFFERSGYKVEIGEGRNDGGIDARVWNKNSSIDGPPTILIQCKRYKNKIDKMVVKSLWADLVDENAEKGLIVTTSSLSPGAEKVCIARNYPIGQVNQKTLKEWIKVMRTPYSGIFLSE